MVMCPQCAPADLLGSYSGRGAYSSLFAHPACLRGVSELRPNMIHRMTTENSREATILRVGHVCQTAYVALRRGLATADKLHEIANWNPTADIHLHRHMTRRDAMEDLKQVSVGDVLLEDDDNLGLAMSGLIVELPEDTIHTGILRNAMYLRLVVKPVASSSLKVQWPLLCL